MPRLSKLGAGSWSLGPKGMEVIVGTSLGGQALPCAVQTARVLCTAITGTKQEQKNTLLRNRDNFKLHFQQVRGKEMSNIKYREG